MTTDKRKVIDLTKKHPLRIVVFASGYGSNFQSMINRFRKSDWIEKIKIVGLFTDNLDAYAIRRAKKYNIPFEIIDPKDYKNRVEFDKAVLKRLGKYKPDLIVLAGYLKVIKYLKFFVKYDHRIINIHPALLPSFKGTIHAQENAFKSGVKVSGITIHFVTKDVDRGEIILQKCVDISDCKSSDDVKEKISRLEHRYYPNVIEMFANGKIKIIGKRVRFLRTRD